MRSTGSGKLGLTRRADSHAALTPWPTRQEERMGSMNNQRNNTGANLGFEDKLWAAADKLRGNMDAAEYKHVVLGLIFLKYISDAFMEKFTALQADDLADPEDKDEYLADNIFWVPSEACLLYTSPSPRDRTRSRMPSSA